MGGGVCGVGAGVSRGLWGGAKGSVCGMSRSSAVDPPNLLLGGWITVAYHDREKAAN
jgi:hypothetical protein